MKYSHKTTLLASCLLLGSMLVGCGEKSDVPISEPTTTGPGESSNGARPGTPGGPPATPDAHNERSAGGSGVSGSRPGM